MEIDGRLLQRNAVGLRLLLPIILRNIPVRVVAEQLYKSPMKMVCDVCLAQRRRVASCGNC